MNGATLVYDLPHSSPSPPLTPWRYPSPSPPPCSYLSLPYNPSLPFHLFTIKPLPSPSSSPSWFLTYLSSSSLSSSCPYPRPLPLTHLLLPLLSSSCHDPRPLPLTTSPLSIHPLVALPFTKVKEETGWEVRKREVKDNESATLVGRWVEGREGENERDGER